MQTLAVSEFKAKCLALLEKVRLTGEPLLLTRRGVPIARLLPPPPEMPKHPTFGCMKGTVEILGDIVAPMDESVWEILH